MSKKEGYKERLDVSVVSDSLKALLLEEEGMGEVFRIQSKKGRWIGGNRSVLYLSKVSSLDRWRCRTLSIRAWKRRFILRQRNSSSVQKVNGPGSGEQYRYGVFIENRYGKEEVEYQQNLKGQIVQYTAKDYKRIYEEYVEKLKDLTN